MDQEIINKNTKWLKQAGLKSTRNDLFHGDESLVENFVKFETFLSSLKPLNTL
jgi:hypothetical protein